MDQTAEVRRFFEVLPELKVEDKLMQLFSIVDVEKVVLDNSTNVLMFHLCSREIIHHAQIVKMQEHIKNKLFPNTPVTIQLREKYLLSEQYTVKYITDVYKDSLLYEISPQISVPFPETEVEQFPLQIENMEQRLQRSPTESSS